MPDKAKVYQALLKLRNARRDLAYAVHGDNYNAYIANPAGYWKAEALDDLERQFLSEQLRQNVADSNT